MTELEVTAPLRVVVFDESRDDAEALESLLQDMSLPVPLEVTSLWHSTELASKLASSVDLLVVDVGQTERPYDGVDLVRALVPQDYGTRIIFTGGGPQAHRRVYLVDHLWHLPKPIDRVELVEAMERAITIIGQDRERPLVVRSGRTDVVVVPRDIAYVESSLRTLSIHESERTIETYGSLGNLARQLPSCFVRCHKSYLVNLDHVRNMGPEGLELDDGIKIPVSQRRRTATRQTLYAHFGSLEQSHPIS